MSDGPCGWLFWAILAIQGLGLVGLVVARMAPHCNCRSTFFSLFLAAMLAVGATTVGCLVAGTSQWLTCGTTLSVMVIGATLNMGRSAQYSSW